MANVQRTRFELIQAQLAVTLVFALLVTGGLVATAHEPLRLIVWSSNEKATLLQNLAKGFNAEVGGRPVIVTIKQMNSGDAESLFEASDRIDASERPAVWSPASVTWVALLRQSKNGGRLIQPGASTSLVVSPLVIGVPITIAVRDLGYLPAARRWATPLGWQDVLALVNRPPGASGSFRLVKTNPNISTSGLHALIGTYLASGAEMTPAGVAMVGPRTFVGDIESAVVHYGPTVNDLLSNLQNMTSAQVVSYLSAVALEEEELVQYNAGNVKGQQGRFPAEMLVPIYPKEGTLLADHPYEVLNWPSGPDRDLLRDAAQQFLTFLQQPRQQTAFDCAGFFRAATTAGTCLAAQPFVNAALPTIVSTPPGPTLKAITGQWRLLRKPARVLVLVNSAVDAGLLGRTLSDLNVALAGFAPQDQVGLWTYPAAPGPGGAAAALPYSVVLPLGPASSLKSVLGLKSAAGTGDLNVTLPQAVAQMAAGYQASSINAVLLVDMSNSPSVRPSVLSALSSQPPATFVRVFTISQDATQMTGISLNAEGASYDPKKTSFSLRDAISNF